jgi:hypothetical protein
VLAQLGQIDREVACRGEGGAVVFAQDLTAAGEGVLIEFTGLPVVAHPTHAQGEAVGCGQSRGMVLAPATSAEGVGALDQRERLSGFAAGVHVFGRAIEEPDNVIADLGDGAVFRGGSEHMGQELLPAWPSRRIAPRTRGRGGAQQSYYAAGPPTAILMIIARASAKQHCWNPIASARSAVRRWPSHAGAAAEYNG